MPDIFMDIKWTCSVCGDSHREQHSIPYPGGMWPQGPYPPRGWRIINYKWVCTNHAVRYLIDLGRLVVDELAVPMAQREGQDA